MKTKIEQQRLAFLEQALKEVQFKGWSEEITPITEGKLNLDIGYSHILFEDGIDSLVTFYEQQQDLVMLKTINNIELTKIRDKVKAAVKARIEAGNKQVLSELLKFYAKPKNLILASKNIWATADLIWQFAGDQSTDYNYYTKRSLLFAVYSSTLAYYLNDDSEDHFKSWEFLDNRIANALKLGNLKNIPNSLAALKSKIPFLRLFK